MERTPPLSCRMTHVRLRFIHCALPPPKPNSLCCRESNPAAVKRQAEWAGRNQVMVVLLKPSCAKKRLLAFRRGPLSARIRYFTILQRMFCILLFHVTAILTGSCVVIFCNSFLVQDSWMRLPVDQTAQPQHKAHLDSSSQSTQQPFFSVCYVFIPSWLLVFSACIVG